MTIMEGLEKNSTIYRIYVDVFALSFGWLISLETHKGT
jgi:hypothetical protein